MSSGVLAVVPVIADFTADVCIPSMITSSSSLGIPPEDILIVDNTREGWAGKYGLRTYRDPDGHNLGVAGAWNIATIEVLERNLEYLLIVSTAMEFGPILHTTWLEQMQRFWGERVIECDGHSFHLIAFHRTVFERVGIWDERYYPAYWEADDMSFRMRQVGWEGGWRRCWVNAMSRGHALHVNVVKCPPQPLLAYWVEKWGGPKHQETFTLPFSDKPLDYWPKLTVPEKAELYQLGEYGVDWW